MPGDYFFLNYGVQDGNVMQGLFRVNKTTYQLEVFNGTQWNLVQAAGSSAVANPMSTVERTAIVPASGVLIWDTDYDKLYVGDGKTLGGLNLNAQSQLMTTAERTSSIPAAGVLIWDIDLSALFVGDGTSTGGVSVASGESGIVAGNRLNFDGSILNFNPDAQIVTVSGNTVTLVPDTAYKAYATNNGLTIKATPPAAGYWGYEGHLELFVASLGYVHTDPDTVVLSDALEPDAVNNCTVRFHDGKAIIAVEDHIAGYMVVSATGTSNGSIYYGLAAATDEYISVDASLNGQTLDLAGATTYAGEKHVVGNGYAETILTGGITCTSKTTFSNLSMDGVVASGGTMTLGDVNIPNGATVAVNGGVLNFENAHGEGTVDLNSTCISQPYINLNGLEIINGYRAGAGGAFVYTATASSFILKNCKIHGCKSTTGGAVAQLNKGGEFIGCEVYGNTAVYGGFLYTFINTANSIIKISNCYIHDNAGGDAAITLTGNKTFTVQINGCTFGANQHIKPEYAGATVAFGGTNILPCTVFGFGSAVLSSAAIIDLTGNTNATPIAPGGGITFASGGATVLYSSGAVSGSYMMDNVTLPAGAKLTNTAVVDLNSASVQLTSATTISASGATFANGSATRYSVSSSGTDLGGVIYLYSIGAKAVFSDCTFTGGNAAFGGVCTVRLGSSGGFTREPDAVFSNCFMSGNRAAETGGCIAAMNGGYVKLTGCSATNNRVSGGGAPFFANGGYLWFEGFTGNNYTVLRGGSSYLKITSYNKFESDIIGDAGGGFVIIDSGAVIDLTGNSNATPINPVGGITISGGGYDLPTVIVDSAGESRTFAYANITGTSITKLGLVYGATVTFLDSTSDYIVYYTPDNGTTFSSETVNGSTGTYTVTGALVQVNKVEA